MMLLHVLMLFLLSGGSAEVVPDLESACGQFFAKGKPPTKLPGTHYKQICQTLNNVMYYATFYNTSNRIPVYSAYRFDGIKGCTRRNNWYIEPQLDEDKKDLKNMGPEGTVTKPPRGNNQALDGDYVNSGYNRGHLAPVYLSSSQSCADATFTLTNAAPQASRFNSVTWWNVELNLATYLQQNCKNKPAYIVTGVIQGTVKISMNRVNVPSYFWTAFCCLDQNNQCSITGGTTGTNADDSTITNHSIAELEGILGGSYGMANFKIFH